MLPLISLRQFFNDMRRQKLRTLLTTFGIFWGSCSIVLLFAFGTGLKEQQMKSQKGMGENIAIFWPGITAKEYRGFPKGRRVWPTESDVVLVKSRARTIARISPEFRKNSVPLKYGKTTTLRPVAGVWPEFGDMRNILPQQGSRFINDRDMKERRRVVFLGNQLASDLFGSDDAVGKRILLGGAPFTVIGVMKEKQQNSSYSGRDDRQAWIPASTFQSMYSRRYVNDFVAQAKKEYSMRQSRREIFEILGARHHFDPDDHEALSVWDTTRGIEFLNNFFSVFRAFLVGIGITTLITGAIGVSNIMNVVLEERTKEIGIKMALGARQGTILSQFMFETMLITALGGIGGFAFAALIVQIVGHMGLEDYIGVPVINIWAGILVTVLLGIVGFLAGIFPARRAANLQPVQALKLF
ncbi:MAG: FtsX-like permease family protein [Candidatus Zixiibacteriota bacterium]|nr:MAG: FtsX-like permease family protein [candidate division Zixibacteria bacterium]